MFETTITNPKTGRANRVKAWKIDPEKIVAGLKAGTITARDISWSLLGDEESYQEMADTESGDCAKNNFALSIFESALDWTLGLAVLDFVRGAAKQGKMPKPFSVAVNHTGDVFVIGASGHVYG